jgi:hypothetical protein
VDCVPPAVGAASMVSGDADQLTQLLLNIALNGVQALAPVGGGTMTFALPAEKQGGKRFHVVRVANSGPPSRRSSSSGSSILSSLPRTGGPGSASPSARVSRTSTTGC